MDHSDVVIEGDISAQQAIRFNIFHLNQTYTGKDERLNIVQKVLPGEKYGGSTYWDTEAFGLPFFLKTADREVGKTSCYTGINIWKKKYCQRRETGFLITALPCTRW